MTCCRFDGRCRTRFPFVVGLFSNQWVFVGIAATRFAQAAFAYLPLMNHLLNTAPVRRGLGLHRRDRGGDLAAVELEKWLRFGRR